MLKFLAPIGGKKIINWLCCRHGNQMGLISLLFRWFHSRKDKSFRLKRKTVKRPETDVHILGGYVLSRWNSFRRLVLKKTVFLRGRVR